MYTPIVDVFLLDTNAAAKNEKAITFKLLKNKTTPRNNNVYSCIFNHMYTKQAANTVSGIIIINIYVIYHDST